MVQFAAEGLPAEHIYPLCGAQLMFKWQVLHNKGLTALKTDSNLFVILQCAEYEVYSLKGKMVCCFIEILFIPTLCFPHHAHVLCFNRNKWCFCHNFTGEREVPDISQAKGTPRFGMAGRMRTVSLLRKFFQSNITLIILLSTDSAIPAQGNTAEIVLTALHQNFIGVDEFLGMVVLPLSSFDVYERPRIRFHLFVCFFPLTFMHVHSFIWLF